MELIPDLHIFAKMELNDTKGDTGRSQVYADSVQNRLHYRTAAKRQNDAEQTTVPGKAVYQL
jgi:hypothetical protein